MLQLAKQIIAAGAVSISQTNAITTGNTVAKLCVHAWYSYTSVAMVDCVILTTGNTVAKLCVYAWYSYMSVAMVDCVIVVLL